MPSHDLQKLFFQDKRRGLELEQLRSQLKHAMDSITKLRIDLESLRAKTGGVEAGNMPARPPVSADMDKTVPE